MLYVNFCMFPQNYLTLNNGYFYIQIFLFYLLRDTFVLFYVFYDEFR